MLWQTCHALTPSHQKSLGDKGFRRSYKAVITLHPYRWVPILHVMTRRLVRDFEREASGINDSFSCHVTYCWTARMGGLNRP